MSLLTSIVAGARARNHASPGILHQGRRSAGASLRQAVAGRDSVAVVAEFKRRSPSAGALAEDRDPVDVAACYVAAGAAGMSILTEPVHFGGCLNDLRRVRNVFPDLPLLMKDFVIDPCQVVQGAAAGASAVLLIVRLLAPAQLDELASACRETGLEPLLECHDESDLQLALGQPAAEGLIGINNRDLDTLQTDCTRTVQLLPSIPADRVILAESGYGTPGEVRALTGLCDGALVGTALLRSGDPKAFLAEVGE